MITISFLLLLLLLLLYTCSNKPTATANSIHCSTTHGAKAVCAGDARPVNSVQGSSKLASFASIYSTREKIPRMILESQKEEEARESSILGTQ